MRVKDFDYKLPESFIAERPVEKRDESRLMVMDRVSGHICHQSFRHVLKYLKPNDTLVLNNSKVIPARMRGRKTGSEVAVEFLLIKRIRGNIWKVMVKPGRRLKPGASVEFEEGVIGRIKDYGSDGTRIVEFTCNGAFMEALNRIGNMPLPPYIKRNATDYDKERYQTVYCREEGSVAAPTAGLHFTQELLEKIKGLGINICYVTLHVGIGTFRPVKVDEVEDHIMHFEEYEISDDASKVINETKAGGGRVISVGTTSTRTLESAADEYGRVSSLTGSTGIFIYPGYKFKVIDGLITNFHLPKSTLLMLISAFSDRDKILNAYEVAKEEGYRFFSYGDAMLII